MSTESVSSSSTLPTMSNDFNIPSLSPSASPVGADRLPRSKELKAWAEKWKLEDKWWISAHGKVFGPYVMDEVERRCNLLPSKKIMVLHVSSSENKQMNWIEMEATPKGVPITGAINLEKFKITSQINVNNQGYKKNL